MAELHVRNLPPEVHLWLRQRAQGRSMSTEAVAILRAALQGAQSGAGRSQAIDRLRAVRGRAHLGADDRLAEELVREDRELSRGRHDGDESQAGYRASEAQDRRA